MLLPCVLWHHPVETTFHAGWLIVCTVLELRNCYAHRHSIQMSLSLESPLQKHMGQLSKIWQRYNDTLTFILWRGVWCICCGFLVTQCLHSYLSWNMLHHSPLSQYFYSECWELEFSHWLLELDPSLCCGRAHWELFKWNIVRLLASLALG